ncbi:hypothetical protein [Pseudomonas veronii]|uniref:hypothetical protein n=1 Tax=Pseudomonas veronii TaxID=76761 RepID=UPI00163D09D4|nr:hypothetical protein [Pseudomonas veronii]
MSIFKHIWWAVRYGDWSAGWDADWGTKPNEPFLHCTPMYYDGYHCYLRIGKFWFGVTY